MLEASAEAAAEKAKAKVARQEATKSNKPSTSTSGDHNPLMGGGGISGCVRVMIHWKRLAPRESPRPSQHSHTHVTFRGG